MKNPQNIQPGDLVIDPNEHIGRVEVISESGRVIVNYDDTSAWHISALRLKEIQP